MTDRILPEAVNFRLAQLRENIIGAIVEFIVQILDYKKIKDEEKKEKELDSILQKTFAILFFVGLAFLLFAAINGWSLMASTIVVSIGFIGLIWMTFKKGLDSFSDG